MAFLFHFVIIGCRNGLQPRFSFTSITRVCKKVYIQLSSSTIQPSLPFPFPPSSPPKNSLFYRAEDRIGNRTEGEREREPDIAAVLQTDALANGANKPDLSHAENGAHDAEAERHDGGDAGRERGRGGIDGDVVLATREDEMFRQGDTFVDGEPVALGERVSWARVVFGMKRDEGEGGRENDVKAKREAGKREKGWSAGNVRSTA